MADGLEQKIDKLMVMMGKLVIKDDGQNRQFKLQVYQNNRGREQTRHNYKWCGFQDKVLQVAITNSEVVKTGLGQTVAGAIYLEEGQGMDKVIEVGQGMI